MSDLPEDLKALASGAPEVADWPGLVRAEVGARHRRRAVASAALSLACVGVAGVGIVYAVDEPTQRLVAAPPTSGPSSEASPLASPSGGASPSAEPTVVPLPQSEEPAFPPPASSAAPPESRAPSPAGRPAAPSPPPAGPREVVINDTEAVVTLYCADCPRDGVVIKPAGRASFVRVDSDYVRYERQDGTATCIGYGTPTSSGNAAREDNELYVSQAGNCPDDYGRPS